MRVVVILALALIAAFVIGLAIGAYLVIHGHPWFGAFVMLLSVLPLAAINVKCQED